MKTLFGLALVFTLVWVPVPDALGGEQNARTEAPTKKQNDPEKPGSFKPEKSVKPASVEKPSAAKQSAASQPAKPATANKQDPGGSEMGQQIQEVHGRDPALTPDVPDAAALRRVPDKTPEFGDLGLGDGGAADALLREDMDAMVVDPNRPADEPGVEGDDPTETSGPGDGLDLTEVTGAVDPVEMGGLDSTPEGAGELRHCVRGECDDGKVATVAPGAGAGDPIDPDRGWTDPVDPEGTDPPLGGGDETDQSDINPCALNATCETAEGETQDREDETEEDDCDDSDSDENCSQYVSDDSDDSGETRQADSDYSYTDDQSNRAGNDDSRQAADRTTTVPDEEFCSGDSGERCDQYDPSGAYHGVGLIPEDDEGYISPTWDGSDAGGALVERRTDSQYGDGPALWPPPSAPTEHDSDGDGLTDEEEKYEYHTNPLDADTDNDGLTDGFEVSDDVMSIPTTWDSDGDGASDYWELLGDVTDSAATDPDEAPVDCGWSSSIRCNQSPHESDD